MKAIISLDYNILTLDQLTKKLPLNADDIFEAACQGYIQIGVESIGWLDISPKAISHFI